MNDMVLSHHHTAESGGAVEERRVRQLPGTILLRGQDIHPPQPQFLGRGTLTSI